MFIINSKNDKNHINDVLLNLLENIEYDKDIELQQKHIEILNSYSFNNRNDLMIYLNKQIDGKYLLENGENLSFNINILLDRVAEIYDKKDKVNKDKVRRILSFLYNSIHDIEAKVSLEETQLNLKNRIKENEKIVIELKTKIDDSYKEIEQLTKKLDSSEMSIIATMGIFAGIVLTFGASTTLITGIVNSLSGASLSTFMFVIGMTGFIFSNVVIMMFYFISKLSNKNISSMCRSWSKESKQDEKLYICGNGYCNKESKTDSKFIFIFCKLWNRYFYILSINIVFALMVIFGVLTDLLIHNL